MNFSTDDWTKLSTAPEIAGASAAAAGGRFVATNPLMSTREISSSAAACETAAWISGAWASGPTVSR